LSADIADRPDDIGAELRALIARFDSGELRPLPCRVFAFEKAPDAFRHMAQARHIGKIVLTNRANRHASFEEMTRGDGSYLVTGGLGGLGLFVAERLAQRGARHIVLVGRNEPGASAKEKIASIEALGAKVQTIRGDVSKSEDVDRIMEAIRREAPPLRGVVHSAGVLADGVLTQQTWERFEEVFGAKVHGSWLLHRATENEPLDFFILFSSVASLMGSPGQGNHAAANAFMDALAHYRASRGLSGLSVNWNAWAGAGAAVDHDVADRFAAKGMEMMASEDALDALEKMARAATVQAAAMPVRWPLFLKSFSINGKIPVLFSDFAQARREPSGTARSGGGKGATSAAASLLDDLATAPANKKRTVLIERIASESARILALDGTDELDYGKPLSELGLDSLMAVELRNALGAAIGQTLPATLLFDYPTINALTGFLADETLKLGDEDQNTETAEEVAPSEDADLLSMIEGMDDEEVDRLFKDKGDDQ
jgi:NAD(P)-dependent dehydrogenase (short-subunit alcohol dehydrogenase family)/acyl carrier protein